MRLGLALLQLVAWLERFPAKRNRFAGKETLKIQCFEQILIAKVLCTFAGFALAAAPALAELRSMPVPTVTIYPGDIVAANTIAEKQFSAATSGFGGFVLTREQLEGRMAKRTLLPGQPVPLAAVKLPDAVQQGVPVLAMFRAAGLTITTYLTPLRSAAAGNIVEARNPETGIVVKTMVQADGTLLVGGP